MEENSLFRQGDGFFVERISRSQGFAMPTHHFHNTYEIYYLVEGTRLYFLENKVYRIQAGGLVFISPNHIHRTVEEESSTHERFLLGIERSVVSRICQTLPGVPFPALLSRPTAVLQLSVGDQSRMIWLLEEMLRELGGRNNGREVAFLLLADLLVHLLRGAEEGCVTVSAEESKHHREIYEIAEYISREYASISSLDLLCDRFYMSKSHLCREFKRITGLTVQGYITATRMRSAGQLLLNSRCSVTEVARQVGYGSMTHFERVFKEHMGTSPLRFRKRLSAVSCEGAIS